MLDDRSIGIVGYGEIGRLLAHGLVDARYGTVTVFSPSLARQSHDGPGMQGMHVAFSLNELCSRSTFILNVAPGSQSLAIAREISKSLNASKIYVDCASTNPLTKSMVFDELSPTGALIGDAIIDGSIARGLQIEILVSGPAASVFSSEFNAYGMCIREIAGPCGKAAALKMVRSVATKGLSILLLETMMAARQYGIDDYILATLEKTFAKPLPALLNRLVPSALHHASRRHDEMQDATDFLRANSLPTNMTAATTAGYLALKRMLQEMEPPPQSEETWQDCIDWLIEMRQDVPLRKTIRIESHKTNS